MSGIFIVAAKRTPFGAFGGSLAHRSATQLGVDAVTAALTSGNVSPDLVNAVYFGNVIQTSADAAYLARHVGLQAKCPVDTPALTINRLCGSGFETVVLGHQFLSSLPQAQPAQVVIAGGTENMSQAPLVTYDARWGGVKLGQGLHLRDALWDGLTDSLAKSPMGVTAENLAKDYHISRQDCDQYAIRSQQLWQAAQQAGVFDAELAPIELHDKKKKTTRTLTTDEHPRPDSKLEKLSALPTVFDKEGVVTAANSSGICDGAGAVILATEQAVTQHNLTPLCRVVGYGVAGCDPTRMGIGPVPAIHKALAMTGLSLQDMDRVEVNEAFAAQVLAVAKELQLDMDKTNSHGGAIALGHPLGASGSRIMAHLAHEFAAKPNHKYHIGAACIGGGQGIAVILERA